MSKHLTTKVAATSALVGGARTFYEPAPGRREASVAPGCQPVGVFLQKWDAPVLDCLQISLSAVAIFSAGSEDYGVDQV